MQRSQRRHIIVNGKNVNLEVELLLINKPNSNKLWKTDELWRKKNILRALRRQFLNTFLHSVKYHRSLQQVKFQVCGFKFSMCHRSMQYNDKLIANK